jgi:xanthine/uracil/vitamin C permease (AzgA family)
VRTDALASVVVFLVALPLCMGVAIASGAPPAAGLITGVVGGLVVGTLAGSPLQVSGPAAGLSVIVWELLREHGAAGLGVIVLLAGLMQLAAGAMRLGQWFRAVSPAVIHGMLAGIGVLIAASQFHVMVDDGPKGSGIDNLLSIPAAVLRGIAPPSGTAHHIAATIGLATIAWTVLWARVAPRRLRAIPAPLVAVAAATAIAAALALPVRYVDVPENLWDAVRLPTADALRSAVSVSVMGAAAALAAVASAETLLCAAAVDQKHTGPRTDYDRELVAQGVGNAVCGVLGALPLTGVIVRSSANVDAGARTRLSAVLHGAWILAFVVLLPGVLERIPCPRSPPYSCTPATSSSTRRPRARSPRTGARSWRSTPPPSPASSRPTCSRGCSSASRSRSRSWCTRSPTSTRPSSRARRRGATWWRSMGGDVRAAARARGRAGEGARRPSAQICADRLAYIDHACLEHLTSWQRQHEAAGGRATISWGAPRDARAAPRPVVSLARGAGPAPRGVGLRRAGRTRSDRAPRGWPRVSRRGARPRVHTRGAAVRGARGEERRRRERQRRARRTRRGRWWTPRRASRRARVPRAAASTRPRAGWRRRRARSRRARGGARPPRGRRARCARPISCVRCLVAWATTPYRPTSASTSAAAPNAVNRRPNSRSCQSDWSSSAGSVSTWRTARPGSTPGGRAPRAARRAPRGPPLVRSRKVMVVRAGRDA